MSLDYNFSYFKIGAKLEYQYGINPQMDILSNHENHSDATVDLGSANIVQVSFPIRHEVNEMVDMYFEYVYEHQIIEKSNAVPYVIGGVDALIYEPASTANNNYLKFGATFKF